LLFDAFINASIKALAAAQPFTTPLLGRITKTKSEQI
jgi:hypothetical protein